MPRLSFSGDVHELPSIYKYDMRKRSVEKHLRKYSYALYVSRTVTSNFAARRKQLRGSASLPAVSDKQLIIRA